MIISTKYGKISGIEKKNSNVYLGIPYAQPPVGALRWKAPQPCKAWEGVLDASREPPRSMQVPRVPGSMADKEFGGGVFRCSEDSLTLNMWVPKNAAGKKLPVAVWIHGGVFLRGFANEREYDGTALNESGVILVSVNYRLGAFGFLAHPWLTAEAGTSGNYGILDQIAALKWVQENIAAFGGDPENVTVFGQSAGAMSVLTLISSPLTKGLFCKAILQSGLGLDGDVPLTDGEADGVDFAALAGASSLEELRALPAERVLELSEKITALRSAAGRHLAYVPLIDGKVLPDGYRAQRGAIPDMPLMVGSTKDDIGTPGQLYAGAEAFARDISARHQSGVYVYSFVHPLPGDDSGAFHSGELWYMFGSLPNCWRPFTPADYELSARMVKSWTDFMKSGNPGWSCYTQEHPYVQILDTEE